MKAQNQAMSSSSSVSLEIKDFVDISASRSNLYRALARTGKAYSNHSRLYRPDLPASQEAMPNILLARSAYRQETLLLQHSSAECVHPAAGGLNTEERP